MCFASTRNCSEAVLGGAYLQSNLMDFTAPRHCSAWTFSECFHLLLYIGRPCASLTAANPLASIHWMSLCQSYCREKYDFMILPMLNVARGRSLLIDHFFL